MNFPPSRSNVYAQINFAHKLIEILDKDNPQPPANLQLPSLTELDRILINAAENALNLGDKRTEAYALGNRGRLYELTGELSTAETYTQQAIALTSTLDSADINYQYFWQLGRIQNRQGDTEKAIAAYTKAFNSLQSLRSDIATINPEVPEELQTIREIGLTKRSLLNNQFTRQALKQNITASGSPIIHLATHAKFSSKAEDTFILSWDGRINIKELDDLLRDDTFNRKNDIELLVLSACETASGDSRATLGLAGLDFENNNFN